MGFDAGRGSMLVIGVNASGSGTSILGRMTRGLVSHLNNTIRPTETRAMQQAAKPSGITFIQGKRSATENRNREIIKHTSRRFFRIIASAEAKAAQDRITMAVAHKKRRPSRKSAIASYAFLH